MSQRERILGLIPHAGSMCLLDGIEHWDAEAARCRSASHRRADHPLRAQGRLSALHLVEYGAQAMAVHGGLLAEQAGGRAAPGMLVAVRDLQLQVQQLDDIAADLVVEARKRLAGPGGWLYDFSVHADRRLLARGRLSVLPLPPSPTAA